MTKADFITLLFLLLGLTFIALGVYHKLEQRKKQTICMGHLHQLGTAINLSSIEFRSRLEVTNSEDWLRSISSYLYDPNVMNCPTHKQGGYVTQFSHLKKNIFPNKEQQAVVFDGQENSYDYRHLGGANVLFSNGVVTFQDKKGIVREKYQLKLK